VIIGWRKTKVLHWPEGSGTQDTVHGEVIIKEQCTRRWSLLMSIPIATGKKLTQGQSHSLLCLRKNLLSDQFIWKLLNRPLDDSDREIGKTPYQGVSPVSLITKQTFTRRCLVEKALMISSTRFSMIHRATISSQAPWKFHNIPRLASVQTVPGLVEFTEKPG